jgi:hypothetical protein
MEVLESTEKMDLGLQRRAAIVAASKECFSSAVKQPADGLPLSNSVRVTMTGLARTPANKYALFGIAVNTPTSQRASINRTFLAVDGGLGRSPL